MTSKLNKNTFSLRNGKIMHKNILNAIEEPNYVPVYLSILKKSNVVTAFDNIFFVTGGLSSLILRVVFLCSDT